jgi:hypothetical protein
MSFLMVAPPKCKISVSSLTFEALYVKLFIAPSWRSFFCAMIHQALKTGVWTNRKYTLYEKGAGGVVNESQNRNGMHGLQAEKLQYDEEQKE